MYTWRFNSQPHWGQTSLRCYKFSPVFPTNNHSQRVTNIVHLCSTIFGCKGETATSDLTFYHCTAEGDLYLSRHQESGCQDFVEFWGSVFFSDFWSCQSIFCDVTGEVEQIMLKRWIHTETTHILNIMWPNFTTAWWKHFSVSVTILKMFVFFYVKPTLPVHFYKMDSFLYW